MKRSIFVSLFWAYLLSSCSIVYAQIGTLNELKAAITNDNRPQYLSSLMHALSEDINVLCKKNDCQSPRNMLALYTTMPIILSVIQDVVKIAAGESIWHNYGDKALNEAIVTTRDFAKRHVEESAFNAAHHVAYNFIAQKARNSASEAFALALNQDRIFYRSPSKAHVFVVQWAAFNYLHENFLSIAEPVFQQALESLPQCLTHNPFMSFDVWFYDQKKQRDHISREALVFLEPWLSMLDVVIMERDASAFEHNQLPWLVDELTTPEFMYNNLRFVHPFSSFFAVVGY